MGIRVVVIGYGSIGQRHAKIVRKTIGEENVLHLPAGNRENIPQQTLVANILAFEPSHIIIATPATQHIPLLLNLLDEVPTANILVEKPLASNASMELTPDVVQVLLKNESRIFVGYNLHFTDHFQFIKNNISRLGDMLWADLRVGQHIEQWRPGRDLKSIVSLSADHGGGALNELSHELEMAVSLFGALNCDHAVAQRGVFGNHVEVEEAVQVHLSGERSSKVSLQCDFYRRVPERKVFLIGKQGQLSVDFIANNAVIELNGRQSSVTFNAVDTYQMQINEFLSGHRTKSPMLEDSITTAKLISVIKEQWLQ